MAKLLKICRSFFWGLLPFLWAMHPFFFLMTHNIHQIQLQDVLLPGLLLFSVLCVLWGGFYWKQKNVKRAGLFLILSSQFLFSYGYFARLWPISPIFSSLSIFLWCGSFYLFFVALMRSSSKTQQQLLELLAWMGAVFYLFMGWDLLHYGWKVQRLSPQISIEESSLPQKTISSNKPDIYYLVFDRYAGFQTLQRVYQFNNAPFLTELQKRGFYLALRANANYLKTAHSLACSLHLNYLDELTKTLGKQSSDWTPLYHLLKDYRVWRLLKEQGYQFVHFGSWWSPTAKNPYADLNVNYISLSEFLSVFYQNTFLYGVVSIFGYKPSLFLLDPRREHYERVLYKFEQLKKMPMFPGPKFVFVHMITPHVPYVFDAEGRYVTWEETRYKSKEENYIQQLRFLNTKLLEVVDSLQKKSSSPPIILLQSDEGPLPIRYETSEQLFNWKQATSEELKEKFEIFSAYYLPGVEQTALYPEISPVNSFRLIFNLYFGTQFKLLPDESFAFENEQKLYDFFRVTPWLRK